MNRALQTCLFCCVFASSNCVKADSQPNEAAATEIVRRPVINTLKLADMRGGLSIAGLDYSIGAVMRTLVDGSVVLESAIDLGSMTGSAVSNNFVLNDAKGITEVSHDLSNNRIVATVVNQANQREIQVELDINVTLQNYESLQSISIRNQILKSLNGIISN